MQEQIQKICNKYKEKVIFDKRPNSLSKDKTSTKEVLKDLFDRRVDIFMKDSFLLLEPTSPLRELKTINLALKLFKKKQLLSMVSVIKQNNLIIGNYNDYLSNIFELNTSQRQKRKTLYEVVGVFYLSKLSICLKKGFLHSATYLYEVSKREGIDINDKIDLKLARKIAEE